MRRRTNAGDETFRAAERRWAATGDAQDEGAYLAAWERAGRPGRDPRRDPVPGDVVDAAMAVGWRGSRGHEIRRYEVIAREEPERDDPPYVARRQLGWIDRSGGLRPPDPPVGADAVKLATWRSWSRGGRVIRRMPVELPPKTKKPRTKRRNICTCGRRGPDSGEFDPHCLLHGTLPSQVRSGQYLPPTPPRENPRVPGTPRMGTRRGPRKADTAEDLRGYHCGRRAALEVITKHGDTLAQNNLRDLEAHPPESPFEVGYVRGYREVVSMRPPRRGNPDERLRDLERRAAMGDPEAAAALARLQQRSGPPPWEVQPWARLLMDALSNVDTDEAQGAVGYNLHYVIARDPSDTTTGPDFMTHVMAYFGSLDSETEPDGHFSSKPGGVVLLKRKHWAQVFDARQYPDMRPASWGGSYEEEGYLFLIYNSGPAHVLNQGAFWVGQPVVVFGSWARWRPTTGLQRRWQGTPYWIVDSEFVPKPGFGTSTAMWEIAQSGVIG